jgi:hypothetical protein
MASRAGLFIPSHAIATAASRRSKAEAAESTRSAIQSTHSKQVAHQAIAQLRKTLSSGPI